MTTGRQAHWERVYRTKSAGERSWFEPRPETSLALLERSGHGPDARVIDVGGGTGRLVDALVDGGYRSVTVVDIAGSAIAEAQRRLGPRAQQVRWIEGDVTDLDLAAAGVRADVWHDRAAFHFLTEPADRTAYSRNLRAVLEPGGHAIVATFAEDGPERCSGLPVVRYSLDALRLELGEGFELVEGRPEVHRTPAGREQRFVYGLFRRTG